MNGGEVSHDQLMLALVMLCVPNIVIGCFYIFQHRLLWRDYVKRKHLNGDSEKD